MSSSDRLFAILECVHSPSHSLRLLSFTRVQIKVKIIEEFLLENDFKAFSKEQLEIEPLLVRKEIIRHTTRRGIYKVRVGALV